MLNETGLSKNVHTFIGCDHEYEGSQIVVFGAPFDSTTSYRPGTRFASAAIRNESDGIETYSPYQDRDLTDIRVFDGGDLLLGFGNPQRALDIIEAFTDRILSDNKLPCMIGGEHLVTLGAVRAMVKHYPQLHILHFDAHMDLRQDYLGETLSHATVMRRCWELTGDQRIFQFGIRSGEREEYVWAKDHVHTTPYDFTGLDQVVAKLAGKPVYITIDLDVLDPSAFPGTGTPEAGGVTFVQLFKALQQAAELNIVGVDMNELSPHYDQSGISTALACKVLRELLLLLGK